MFLIAYIPAYIINYKRFKIRKNNYKNLSSDEKLIIDELASEKFDE